MRVLRVAKSLRRLTPSRFSLKSSGRGIISTKLNRRCNAVSSRAIERSAVFVLNQRYEFAENFGDVPAIYLVDYENEIFSGILRGGLAKFLEDARLDLVGNISARDGRADSLDKIFVLRLLAFL